jgi:hypothetical protein
MHVIEMASAGIVHISSFLTIGSGFGIGVTDGGDLCSMP